MHRDAAYYQFAHGFGAQAKYVVEHYPSQLHTYVISGNHDISHFNETGANIVQTICEARDDMTHIGDLGAYVDVGPLNAYLWHPAGGVPYARSYRQQKWIEQVPGGEKPTLLFTGHLHVSDILPSYRNVSAFMVPCFQAQTPYLRRKGLSPDIGGYVIEARWDEEKHVTGVKVDWKMYRVPQKDDY